MKHLLSRRRTAIFAVISGVSGIVANVSLAGFFAMAAPWSDTPSRWAWLGPVNDVTGAISMAALIPVAIHLRRTVPPSELLRLLSGGAVAGMGALAVVAPLMLSGVVSLTAQFAVAGVALPVIFGWLVVVNRAGRRAGVLPDTVAVFGRTVGAAALVGTALAAAGALAPAASTVQQVLLAAAAVIGLPAYLAFPVWPILLARRVLGRKPRRVAAGDSLRTRRETVR
ncbi:hypothetical protein ACVBEQ_02685 [Nakamurella sp. GG22]